MHTRSPSRETFLLVLEVRVLGYLQLRVLAWAFRGVSSSSQDLSTVQDVSLYALHERSAVGNQGCDVAVDQDSRSRKGYGIQ